MYLFFNAEIILLSQILYSTILCKLVTKLILMYFLKFSNFFIIFVLVNFQFQQLFRYCSYCLINIIITTAAFRWHRIWLKNLMFPYIIFDDYLFLVPSEPNKTLFNSLPQFILWFGSCRKLTDHTM